LPDWLGKGLSAGSPIANPDVRSMNHVIGQPMLLHADLSC
jgi:hypothetical protein